MDLDGSKHKEWHRITKNNYQTLGHYGVDLLYNDRYCMDKFRKIFTESYDRFRPGMILSGVALKIEYGKQSMERKIYRW